MKSILNIFVYLISISLFFIGGYWFNQQKACEKNPCHEAIVSTAQMLYVDTTGKSDDALMSEIQSKIRSSKKACLIPTYSAKEWKFFLIYESSDPQMIEKIRKQDEFIKQIQGKEILVLDQNAPKETQEGN